ncbi:hypothetical protein [Ferrimonas aestuarii]|uniref:Extradiol ring-cleavage dioxygenase LigAB LigA subunit domain-containing protein n=1 Tax=Ferrimonas aestuarii TaxID=2569539 RepID=A0A4U1BKD0_9GAMM|nr:hypothetical protein [Ferrimonas aestuarii]TKB52767.1 hypothetical protein FCL42_15775 [Ferrimonas aestuarii]
MNHQATQLLIKLGLDADLHQRFNVNPDLVMDELGLDMEAKSEVLKLSDAKFSKVGDKKLVEIFTLPNFVGISN